MFMSCELTTVEVDERLLGDLGLDVTLVLSLLELLDGGVVGGDIGVVVLGVVELHDLAADGGLERAVVVCVLKSALALSHANAQGR
jgi:hypothetical protein